jgi:hypothetical protein
LYTHHLLLENDAIFFVIQHTLTQTINHCLIENVSSVWNWIVEEVESGIKEAEAVPHSLMVKTALLRHYVAFRKGGRVISKETTYDLACNILSASKQGKITLECPSIQSEATQLFFVLLSISDMDVLLLRGKNVITEILSLQVFCTLVITILHFSHIFL